MSNKKMMKVIKTINNNKMNCRNNNRRGRTKRKMNRFKGNNNKRVKKNKMTSKRHKCSSNFNNRVLSCPVSIIKEKICLKLLTKKLILSSILLMREIMSKKMMLHC